MYETVYDSPPQYNEYWGARLYDYARIYGLVKCARA